MASSRQEYFILRSDVPIAKVNNFLRYLLGTQNADHVLKGELLVKEALPQDGSHQSHASHMYSLALDRHKKVSCSNTDVAPLSEDDYEWLAAIGKTIDRWHFYIQGDKLEAVKKLQVGENVQVCLPLGDGTPPHLPETSCCHATVQYIGPLQDTPGRWIGVELRENRGNCDGAFRDSRYFVCEDGHGAFLPASNILTVSQAPSAPPIPTSSTPTLQGPRSTRKKLLVSSTKTYRDFYLNDRVVVFDKDGRRVPGVAKWASPGQEHGVNCYIIGIETDKPIKQGNVEGHISNTGHLFPHPRHSWKHSYLAVPEMAVLKEGDGTPFDAHSEAMDHTNPPDVTESDSTRSTTAAESQPQPTQPIPPHPVSHNLEVGSAIELVDPPGYGIIRWIGKFPDVNTDIAGIELETRIDGCGDGSWKGEQYFSCRDGHAVFIVLSKLKPDQRFVQQSQGPNQPSMQTSCSCECQLIKDQVTEMKTDLCYQEDSVKEIDCQIKEYKRQNQLLREELTTVKGQVGSCEEALQAKDQQIERLQSEVQALQQTMTQFQASSFTEKQVTEELATVRGQIISCEDTKNQLQQTITDLREDHRQKENEYTARLSAIEAQMRALLPPWAIPETELKVTDTVLGKGAYGEVLVGVYHGDRVAVKQLHKVIVSDYYQKMIQREMGIAARLRHPKLVLFIGAVTRGNLSIVTELMETSLRSELEHGCLKEDHILPISRDVACALCYLHSLPEPIIRRDVSSANVLLNSTKGGWVAKLGDYGSANFQAKLQTVGPGCPVYAAPEASRPEEQGPKMDVYSYGVLMLEMCTGSLPDPCDLPVIQQAVHSWGQGKRQLGGLACQCTLQSSDRRPHMRNVVTQLNGMGPTV